MIYLQIAMMITSVTIGILGIIKINTLPSKELTIKKNYGKIVLYGSISCIVDIIFIIATLFMIPPGEYGNGLELLIASAVLIIFTPFCFVSSYKLQKRMSGLEKEIVKKNYLGRINCLNLCPFIKAILFFVLSIATFELNGIVW